MIIKTITDETFSAYGRVITSLGDIEPLIDALGQKEAPENDVIYVPSDEAFEALDIRKVIEESFFGGMPIQIGYCNGTNNKLNAVEYHRSSELCVAGSDLILLVGKQADLTQTATYDTAQIEAFKVTKGQVFEMYATTLHYAPCSVEGEPFRNVVVLPKGTNTALEHVPTDRFEDKLLVAKNKWLVAHEEAGIEGAFVGLVGGNITV